MKTSFIILFYAWLAAVSVNVQGQSFGAIMNLPAGNYNPAKTIVRAWGGYAVSYARRGNYGYLYLAKVSDMATMSTLGTMNHDVFSFPLSDPSDEINDIQILDDRAYFCGHDSTHAIYGWVDLPFPSGSSNYNHYFLPTGATNLEQMVVYKDALGREKLVAIGEDSPAVSPFICKDVVVEIDDPWDTSPLCKVYNTLPYVNNNKRERLYDIVLTKDSIVLVGCDTELGVPLCSRWLDKNNIASTIQNRYDYLLPNDEANGKVLATVVDSAEYIAIAYVHTEIGIPYSTRVRLIEAMGIHKMDYSQEYIIDEKMPPYELSYDSTFKTLTVLQNCVSPSRESRFRLLETFATSAYNYKYLYFPDVEFTSLYHICKYNYIATGIRKDLTQKYWYMQDLVAPLTQTCPTISTDKATILPSPRNNFNPITVTYSSYNLPSLTPPMTAILLMRLNDCNEPYVK